VSSTYTYVLADESTHEAVVIDPVFELHARDLALVRELELKVKFILDTHCHADHVTGAWLLKQATGGTVVLSKVYGAQNVDRSVAEGDRIAFGAQSLNVLSTAGHTDGCLSFVLGDQSMVFTGDCLMIRGAGRTDFQQGSAHKMFQSIHTKLFALPEACRVYPAHDYDGRSVSTIGEEKRFNTRIGGAANEKDFTGYMNNLHLPHPKKIALALPANLRSGKPEDGLYPAQASWGPVERTYDGIAQVSADWAALHRAEVTLLDVRDPEEWTGELPAIEGALKIPLSDLTAKLTELSPAKPIVTVCRSGKRSAQAVVLLTKAGFEKSASVKDGLLAWRSLFPA
ncbi:MAG: MBL fold metallo-hydrolase, partial [Candidatus Omnitrophica bacterium]|nr:MBL fold metallo-hydrolase [Candidatus Omnitrophota bacterium]